MRRALHAGTRTAHVAFLQVCAMAQSWHILAALQADCRWDAATASPKELVVQRFSRLRRRFVTMESNHRRNGYSHADLRNMLRVVGKPHELERQPLALLLRHAFGMATCQEAVMHLLEMSFTDAGNRTKLLRDIIFTCDVHGATTGAATHQFNLSRRQFFRYRAEAFDVLAATVARILSSPPDDSVYLWTIAHQISMTDPEQALALLDASNIAPYGRLGHFRVTLAVWAGQPVTDDDLARCSDHFRSRAMLRIAGEMHGRGDYARAERILADVRESTEKLGASALPDLLYDIADASRWPARRRCDTAAIAQHVAVMKRNAGGDWSVARVRQAEAEVQINRGDADGASKSLEQAWQMAMAGRDAVLLSNSALGEARLAFIRGVYERAFRFAFAAAVGLRGHRSYSLIAQVIAGKAALAVGKSWQPPEDWVKRYPDSWLRAEVDAIHARRLLAAGECGEAESVAVAALELAERHGSPSGIAYAMATLGAVLDRRGDVAGAQRVRVRAWRMAALLEDAVLHHDLFAISGQIRRGVGPIAIDDGFCAAIVDVAPAGLRAVGTPDVQRAFVRDALLAAALPNAIEQRGVQPARPYADAAEALASAAPLVAIAIDHADREAYARAMTAAAFSVARAHSRPVSGRGVIPPRRRGTMLAPTTAAN